MKPVFIRPAREEDAAQFSNWASQTKDFDPETVRFPETVTLCAFTEERVLGFMAIQSPLIADSLMLESAVLNPEASEMETVIALREFIKSAVTLGYMKGTGELYFLGNDEKTNRIAERIFEKVPWPVYRLRLKDLEPDANTN